MNKTLIVALALSLVLVSGGIYSAQADCGCNPCGFGFLNPCSWHFSSCGCWHFPSCFSCCDTCSKDTDRSNLNNPPAYNNYNRDNGRY